MYHSSYSVTRFAKVFLVESHNLRSKPLERSRGKTIDKDDDDNNNNNGDSINASVEKG